MRLLVHVEISVSCDVAKSDIELHLTKHFGDLNLHALALCIRLQVADERTFALS